MIEIFAWLILMRSWKRNGNSLFCQNWFADSVFDAVLVILINAFGECYKLTNIFLVL